MFRWFKACEKWVHVYFEDYTGSGITPNLRSPSISCFGVNGLGVSHLKAHGKMGQKTLNADTEKDSLVSRLTACNKAFGGALVDYQTERHKDKSQTGKTGKETIL